MSTSNRIDAQRTAYIEDGVWRSRHPRHREALDAKKRHGYLVTSEMRVDRKKMVNDELVIYIRQCVENNPGTYLLAELEHAYWVANISTSKIGFAKAWAEASTAQPGDGPLA